MTTPTTAPTPTLSTGVTPLFVNNDYWACDYAFDTTRKALSVRESLTEDPIEGISICDPSDHVHEAERIVRAIHDPAYVEAVRTGNPRRLAQSQSFTWDRHIWTMALAHFSGMVAAVDHAAASGGVAGSASSGGHHASRCEGNGFCTFNWVAGAAVRALELGAGRVLVLDFDQHCGGGTWDIVSALEPERIVQVDVSITPFDTWSPSGESWFRLADTGTYLETIDEALGHARGIQHDFVVYNAGMDIMNAGVRPDVAEQRERLVREFIGDTPAVFGFAGGYTAGRGMEAVVAWHRLTLEAFASRVE